jgi:hypothetical protein
MARAKTSVPRYVTVFFLGLALVAAWFISPMFLPVWRWRNVDFAAIAQRSGIAENILRTEFNAQVRYSPRGDGDPLPWQLITLDPPWHTLSKAFDNEEEFLVRCTLVGDRNGQPINMLWVGNTAKDRYFTVKAWRFPPGSFGFNAKRPVLVYNVGSLEKMDISASLYADQAYRYWQNDDDWDERDDGWRPGDGAAAQ